MNKRGQVTIFVIVGIVIVISVFLVFYFLGDRIKRQTEVEAVFDESSLEPLQDYVGDCIEKHGNEAIELIDKGGGNIEPGFYQMYHQEKLNLLCYTEEYNACVNRRPFLSSYIEEEINNYLLEKLSECVDLSAIRNEGYTVQEGDIDVQTSIGKYNTIINVDYPITIIKGDNSISENRFSKTFNVPLGKILEAVKDIIEFDSDVNRLPIFNFDVVSYAYRTNGEVEIQVDSIEDSKIYKVNLRDSPYVFQFATKRWVRI